MASEAKVRPVVFKLGKGRQTDVTMLRSVVFVRSVALAVQRSSSSTPVCKPFSCCAYVAGVPRSFYFKWSTPNHPSGRGLVHPAPTANIYTSPSFKGLEEFFPRTDDILEEGEKTGMIIKLSIMHN